MFLLTYLFTAGKSQKAAIIAPAGLNDISIHRMSVIVTFAKPLTQF